MESQGERGYAPHGVCPFMMMMINTPHRRKNTQLVHVNMLKPYIDRNPATDQLGLPCTVKSRDGDNMVETDNPVRDWSGFSNSQIFKQLNLYLGHLCPTQVHELSTVLSAYQDVFSDTPGRCNIIHHDVKLIPGTTPIRQAPYRIPHQKKELMKKEVDYLLENGLAVPSCSPWASPCILVPKEEGTLRLCTDYRRVNDVTVPDAYPLPRVDDLVDSVGQSKFITKIDLLKGYYQIPLTESAQVISAFITPFGLYQYSTW